jgi:pimeloyl-ACP methyl ester carboxylesterase
VQFLNEMNKRLLGIALVAGSAGLLTLAIASTRSAPALALVPCQLPGVTRSARCGSLEVQENPQQPGGRRIAIGVAVIPATTQPALPDPIVLIMGGPGEDAISAASIFVDLFGPLLTDRDLLLVDQRGTGRSNALNCDLFAGGRPDAALHDLFPLAAAQRCERELEARADLAQYTVAQFVHDLEQVRVALGYPQLNLSSGSYGTRSAQHYLRAFPQSVRTVHLGSVVPIDVPPPLTMARSAQDALENIFAACAADAPCHTAFPHLPDEFRAVVAALEGGRARVSVPGLADPVVLNRGRTAEWFRSRLYRPDTAAAVPWLIHRAFLGDWQPIGDGILASGRGLYAALNIGVFFSVTCSEDLAFVGDAEIARETQATFLGDFRIRQQQAVCTTWPKAAQPDGFRGPVQSTVPVLFVSGDADGASPLWFTEHVARGFPNRAELVLGGRGHTDWSDCVPDVYEQFVRSGSARAIDVSACRPTPRPPFRVR